MGYFDSTLYFCMATKTLADLSNKAISQRGVAIKHPLEWTEEARAADDAGALEAQADVRWEQLLSEQRSAITANVDIYLDDFISVVQGGPKKRSQMIWHLFSQIDKVLRPK